MHPSLAVAHRLTFFGLLLLWSAGFAAAQSREQGVIPDAARSPDEGVVFGILEASSYDSKGVKHSAESGPNIRYTITFGPASSLAEQHFTFFAASVAADRVLYGETKVPEVFFAKKMTAGTYYIYEVSRTTPAGTGMVPLVARFAVAPDKATYIGSIQVEFHGAKGVFGDERSGQRASIGVTNDFDKAALQYKERNPHLPFELAIGLMTIGK